MNQFIYSPSFGNSGGLITIWNSTTYNGRLISQSYFHITIEFTCTFSLQTFYVTNIYVACNDEGRNDFIQWFNSLDSSKFELWIVMGDFSLIRSQDDRSRLGGNTNNILLFNSLIQPHDLKEIPLQGRAYT
jgi:hypothetical protein